MSAKDPIDIVATWPKTKLLKSYLEALEEAVKDNQLINFRVSRIPAWKYGALWDRDARCYMVHDGFVRGYNRIKFATFRNASEVKDVDTGDFWPEGYYIVREPLWYPVEPVPMKGFQGWRWYTYDGSPIT